MLKQVSSFRMNKEFAGSEGKEREVILETEGKGGNLDILMN